MTVLVKLPIISKACLYWLAFRLNTSDSNNDIINNNNNNNINNNNNNINNNNKGVMPRPARGAPSFTGHRHSKSPDLCTLTNHYGYQ